MNKAFYWCLIAGLLCSNAAIGQSWQIHEWGTFTSLQDESGQAIGWINTDDEPVPSFVHSDFLPILPAGAPVPELFKGLPRCHPDVTMRLETPVIYFHPPAGAHNGQSASVQVKFRGGWLTQFYPDAIPISPGLTNGFHLRSDTVGTLAWNNLQVGGDWPLTEATEDNVWTSPRNVDASLVQNDSGESEKFLFYRGVGHIDSPLKVSRDSVADELVFHSQIPDLPGDSSLKVDFAWLVDIRPDGRIAFRTLPAFALSHDANDTLLRTPATFTPENFSAGNLEALKSSLKSALVSEGLFPDEAQALLNTWQISYFKSPGLRVFFLVPREWTDFYLPLQISLPSQINRVMVGRIEVVTPEQRAKLRKISESSPVSISSQQQQFLKALPLALVNGGPNSYQRLMEGQTPLSSVVSIPPSYQTYLDLGRFRNALLLDEEKKWPTPGLRTFINGYGLTGYKTDESFSGKLTSITPR